MDNSKVIGRAAIYAAIIILSLLVAGQVRVHLGIDNVRFETRCWRGDRTEAVEYRQWFHSPEYAQEYDRLTEIADSTVECFSGAFYVKGDE